MIRLPFRLSVLALMVARVAQTPAARFDVADVRVAAPNPSPNNSHGGILRGNRYEIRNATMLFLISTAYGVSEEKVTGGPNWLELNRFDVTTQAEGEQPICEASQRPQANGTVLQHITCRNLAMAGLANRLSQPAVAADYFAGQVVANETGLGGRWDFELAWTPRAQLVQAGPDGVSIQKALENIGLKRCGSY